MTKELNPELYQRAYPDVRLSGLSPQDHFERYGRLLGRDPAPDASHTGFVFSEEPALLDLRYAKAPILGSGPVLHDELVSIIMPSYNSERWLRRAIHSAISQNGVKIELLVIDDGSTDGSVKVARQIAENYPNVRVIALLRNFGCYYARNVGIMNARGEYITILDSDDIMSPDRIVRQLQSLKANKRAWANLCQLRRWSDDYLEPISDLKHGENSLLWRCQLIDKIGWYDCVRFGGDTEFRQRIQRFMGSESVSKIDDELYYLRTVKDSLTASQDSLAYKFENGRLDAVLSTARTSYADAFRHWQHNNKANVHVSENAASVTFPQLIRPFKLGSQTQNASPSLKHKCVGAMASFPPRRDSLKLAIESILPQLDQLVLYLNNYDVLPDFVNHPKICVLQSQTSVGDLRDNGKFFDLPQDDSSYIFTLDDDLIYPKNYVANMVHQIELLGRSSIVGLHGVIFPEGELNRITDRTVYHFNAESRGNFVDLLGTGTCAWHSSILKVSLSDFQTTGICDVYFAASAAKKCVPLYSIPRINNWLRVSKKFKETLFSETQSNPDVYFDVYREILKPSLEKAQIRQLIEQHMLCSYDIDTLTAAGMDFQGLRPATDGLPVVARRSIQQAEPANQRYRWIYRQSLHFHIIVNGWNCRNQVDGCLRSIAEQRLGNFSFAVTLIDDGSDDGTYDKLASSTILPNANLMRISDNSGPAYARHLGIKSVQDSDTVIVLVDMDDALEANALQVVAQRYTQNPDCLMTIGNWHDQTGKLNSQVFYTTDEINNQNTRSVELFNATHLRTFRRKLYDAVTEDDLKDQHGKWLETCTDVAMMYPLMDQCWSNEIEFIHDPIYRYTRLNNSGTLHRFGKPHKIERLAWLKSKPPKPRSVVSETTASY